MNLVRVGFLTALLLASSAFGQDKPKGYDVNSCAPTEFAAAHLKIVGKDLQVDKISPGPGKVKEVKDGPIYKFEKEVNGDQYFTQTVKDDDTGKDEQYEIVLTKVGGKFLVDGQQYAVLYVTADDDGSKLVDVAMNDFRSCQDLNELRRSQQMDTDKT